MPDRPLIAVTTSEVRQVTGAVGLTSGDPPRREMVLGLTYLRAIVDAGGVPVVVPPLAGDGLEVVLDRADGLCLTGGPDIDPAAYGDEPDPALGPTDRELDDSELALARAADERGLPILAICRGAQLLNVARGGTLHQDLPTLGRPDGLVHRQPEAGHQPTHPVSVRTDSALAGALGVDELQVNSFHHQAVDRLGSELRVVGRAPDGTVEGFEARDRRFVLAVQWHAELLTGRVPERRLFAAFVAASRRAPSTTAPPVAVAP